MPATYIALTRSAAGDPRAVGYPTPDRATACAEARAFVAQARWGAYVVERSGRRGMRRRIVATFTPEEEAPSA